LRKYADAQKLSPHKPCAKMIEIRGREIRTSEVDDEITKAAGGILLKMGQTVEIRVRKRDLTQVKETLGTAYGAQVQLLAKIDTIESIQNFEELIKTANGIVINRVDFGLEMAAE
jgi:pyruvate kinase